MLSLLICILPCFASASAAPTENEDQEKEVTIVCTYINDEGELILVMSDGTERNADAQRRGRRDCRRNCRNACGERG